jgi:hypothetical protein
MIHGKEKWLALLATRATWMIAAIVTQNGRLVPFGESGDGKPPLFPIHFQVVLSIFAPANARAFIA